jgi:hypothetical protein
MRAGSASIMSTAASGHILLAMSVQSPRYASMSSITVRRKPFSHDFFRVRGVSDQASRPLYARASTPRVPGY